MAAETKIVHVSKPQSLRHNHTHSNPLNQHPARRCLFVREKTYALTF